MRTDSGSSDDGGGSGNRGAASESQATIPASAATDWRSRSMLTDAVVLNSVHFSSKSVEWETPSDLFDRLNQEFRFTRDVCATAENAKLPTYWSVADDAFKQEWTGTLWMNPPYGRAIGHWVAKAYHAACNGATVVCLVPARTDTAWFQNYCQHAEIRFLRGRLKFNGHSNSAPFPSCIVIFHGYLDPGGSVKWGCW